MPPILNSSGARISSSTVFDASTIAMSLWFYRSTALTSGTELIFGIKETGVNDYIDIVMNNDRTVSIREENLTATSVGTVTDETWNHVAINLQTNSARQISLNGELNQVNHATNSAGIMGNNSSGNFSNPLSKNLPCAKISPQMR